MKKIISLFQRNYDGDRLVRDEVVPGAEWVARGEGVATRKFDGTCCMVRDDNLYKRYDAKQGKPRRQGLSLRRIMIRLLDTCRDGFKLNPLIRQIAGTLKPRWKDWRTELTN